MTDRTRRVGALLLAVFVVLAGCNGVFGGESGDGMSTFTPAAVPTDEPTPTPRPRLAPGLTIEGVVNASALAAAHDALLETTSFTLRRTVTYRAENDTPIRRIESVTRVGDGGRFRVTKRWNGTTRLRRVAYYSDGDRLLVATTDTNSTTYRRVPPESAASLRSALAGTNGGRIERLFVIAETRVAGRTERNGTTVYRLHPETARRTRSNATGPDRSVRVRARVTARGLVRRYTFTQRLSGDGPGGAAVIVVSARYTALGSTDIERPAWYETAIAATDARTANRNETDTMTTTAA